MIVFDFKSIAEHMNKHKPKDRPPTQTTLLSICRKNLSPLPRLRL